MEIKALKKSKNELEIEMKNVDEGLLSTITSRLLEKKTVSFASYKRPHPLLPEVLLYVKVTEETQRRYC